MKEQHDGDTNRGEEGDEREKEREREHCIAIVRARV